MERYNGQPLRPKPHLAVLFYDSIGDFVVITPLLRGLHEKYPGCTLDYFSGERTRELEEACPYIDSRFSVFGADDSLRRVMGYIEERERLAGPYDLAINCDFHTALSAVTTMLRPRYAVGNCYNPDPRSDMPYPPNKVHNIHKEIWSSEDFLPRYSDILQSNYIAEIFCRLAWVETDFHRTEVPTAPPPFEPPPVLVSMGGKRPAKMWPTTHWERFIGWCTDQGLEVGLLGDKPAAQQQHYHSADAEGYLLRETALQDLRGTMTLPQVAGALRRARACVTIDNGIMHLAIGVGTPTLALFGASPWRLWTPQAPHLEVVLPETPCSLCQEHVFKNEECLRSDHVCMETITPAAVSSRLAALLSRQAQAGSVSSTEETEAV